MDFWVVAAAAGAGYLAKYWNRLSKNVDSSSFLSSQDSSFENPDSPRHTFGRQPWRDNLGNDMFLDRGASDVNSPDGILITELASNRKHDSEKVWQLRKCNESDMLSVSNLAPLSLSANENFSDIEHGSEQSSNFGGNLSSLPPDLSAGEVGYIHSPSGNKTSLRNKHVYGHVSGPLNSLQSCLMAQLCKENAKMEEYDFGSLTSSSTAARSFRVSDGSQIISRANDDDPSCALIGSEENKLHREAREVEDENAFHGIPCLPKFGSLNDVKKMKFNADNGRRRGRLRSSKDVFNGNCIFTQHDATYLFSLGMSLGIMASSLADKREMDKLRELLKQNESLVQDLQEELEMKDSMTVKELQSENYGSQDTCDHSFCDKELSEFSPEKHMDNSPIIDCKKSYDQKEEENSESMSKIEAELEAELERLGLNMNESRLDERLSELLELDQDFVPDFAQGELQTDMVSGKDFVHPKSNGDVSDAMTFPANYAVSPRELSLRLHEVIQSRLEERVQELEFALQDSRRKLQLIESEHGSCSKYFANCGQASSFTKENLLTYDNYHPVAEPLVMNLSGEALGAYNEAYEELIKINDSEVNSPSSINHGTDHRVGVQHGVADDSMTYSTAIHVKRLSREHSSSEITMLEQQNSNVPKLNDVTEDENYDSDFEVERQLIRQIVEKTKKGSPALKNARMLLYSMDEDVH